MIINIQGYRFEPTGVYLKQMLRYSKSESHCVEIVGNGWSILVEGYIQEIATEINKQIKANEEK